MNKYLKFENLTDFWSKAFSESTAYRKSSRDDSFFNLDWYGNSTWSQAKQIAQQGWLEALPEIEKYRIVLNEMIADKLVSYLPVYAFQGRVIEMGNYLANDPEHFIIRDYNEQVNEGKIITLVCSVSFSAAICSETIIQRGAMICALVDALEYSGYRVELICNHNSKSGSYSFEVDVVVKKANQGLQMAEIVFCLAHPAMLRRMMFSVAEQEGWSDLVSNYGYPFTATEKGSLCINEIFSSVVPDKEAVDWVLKTLSQQGIVVKKV
ncbi:hypothetical protein LZZ90_12715 [Flavobacterium sp. SM15]|uniref:DUF7192 family protein n=1 Tax=Flavobacterium sp. SM15 TaxID=2908005 RepID=UPI001ED9DE6C|nr:hypothetical protein [Flavobacterium sp. SM15]MCG2612370.1 hypothetical protein [Flavobacterium sp. SM15]